MRYSENHVGINKLPMSSSNFMELDIQQGCLLCGQNQFGCSECIVQAGKVTLRNLWSKQTQQDFTSAHGHLTQHSHERNPILSIQAMSSLWSYLIGPYGPGAAPTHPT